MKILRDIIPLLLISIIVGCKDTGPQNASHVPPRPDTVVHASDTDPWHFKHYLSDKKTPRLAKDIFNKKWTKTDEEPLEYLHNLHGQDSLARPFYFKVVTNLYEQSDGALSEGLGNGGYEYVQQYPAEFTSYFIGENAFPDKDLRTWAEIILLEFQIIVEGDFADPTFNEYFAVVRKNCTNCSKQQYAIIERLEKYMRAGWAELLKSI